MKIRPKRDYEVGLFTRKTYEVIREMQDLYELRTDNGQYVTIHKNNCIVVKKRLVRR